MNWESAIENIKSDLQRRAEDIERSIAWCDQYSWEINRYRHQLEQELQLLLGSWQNLTEADQVYGCHDLPEWPSEKY